MSVASDARLFQNGPAPMEHKIIRKKLLQMGVREDRLPEELKDRIVKRAKTGPLGALVVKNISGLVTSPALRIVRRFEENVGGKEEIADKLSAVQDSLTTEQLALLKLLRAPTRKSLAHLMVDAGVEPTSVMGAYAKGCVVLGKIEAAIEAHRNLPGLVKDLYRHALDKETVCMVCVGLKEVPIQSSLPNGKKILCPQCDGSGISLVASKHKEFAHRQLLEMTRLVNPDKGTSVQVNQQVSVGGGQRTGFFEKMLETADNIAFPENQRVVDAEVAAYEEAEIVPPATDR